jgi:hypothetical protein
VEISIDVLEQNKKLIETIEEITLEELIDSIEGI